MNRLRFHLSRNGRADFLRLLDENQIDYRLVPPMGTIVASSEVVEILNAAGVIVGSVASVLVAWLSRNAARRIIFQKRDGGGVHIEATALTPKELEEAKTVIEALVKDSTSVNVIQVKKDPD